MIKHYPWNLTLYAPGALLVKSVASATKLVLDTYHPITKHLKKGSPQIVWNQVPQEDPSLPKGSISKLNYNYVSFWIDHTYAFVYITFHSSKAAANLSNPRQNWSSSLPNLISQMIYRHNHQTCPYYSVTHHGQMACSDLGEDVDFCTMACCP